MKIIIYNLIKKGSNGKIINKYFDYFILWLIVLSVISIAVESINNLNPIIDKIISIFDFIAIIIFSLEYLMRLYVSDLTHPSNNRINSAFKFIFSFYGIIDLLSILPFYLPMLIKIDLRFLRVLRLTRFLRILKINRYNNSLNLIIQVIKEKKAELAVTGFVTLLILIFASFLIYFVEGDAQPEQFPNVFSAIWWAVATLTTVGYGDVYPITNLGKIISGVIAILGIGIIALPTGLISAGFMEKIEKKKEKKCPKCDTKI